MVFIWLKYTRYYKEKGKKKEVCVLVSQIYAHAIHLIMPST